MSQYISYYLKDKHNNFICLGSFSRSHALYVDYAPYEKITEFNCKKLGFYREDIKSTIDAYNKMKARRDKEFETVKTFNNPVEEKFIAMQSIYDEIEALYESIEELEFSLNFLNFIERVVEENEGSKLYYGIECYEPTMEDIVE